jgi:hypothetical protein
MTDKTSGLQFSGEPTERALRAKELREKMDTLDMPLFIGKRKDGSEFWVYNEYLNTIIEALELMSNEKQPMEGK